jgi:glycosyltransferase involved in cell wall biosynthesis
MKISIAMTSYNAERFIGEQLASFVDQTRRPDELVVCDDRSTDRTPEILREFAATSPFPVRLVLNPKQLGLIENFDQSIGLCTGDLIFLSDHDDHWMPDKLAEHEAVHRSDPGVGYVLSNAAVCDAAMNPRGFTLFENKRLTAEKRAAIDRGAMLDMSIRSPRGHGCTMSFDGALKEALLPLPTSTLHDVWLSLMLSALTQTRCIDKPLIRYRTHPSQVCGIHTDPKNRPGGGGAEPDARERLLRSIEQTARYFEDALERARRFEPRLYRKDAVRLLEGKLAHLKSRRRLAGSLPTRLATFAGELLSGRYLRYSNRGDLALDAKLCLNRG